MCSPTQLFVNSSEWNDDGYGWVRFRPEYPLSLHRVFFVLYLVCCWTPLTVLYCSWTVWSRVKSCRREHSVRWYWRRSRFGDWHDFMYKCTYNVWYKQIIVQLLNTGVNCTSIGCWVLLNAVQISRFDWAEKVLGDKQTVSRDYNQHESFVRSPVGGD